MKPRAPAWCLRTRFLCAIGAWWGGFRELMGSRPESLNMRSQQGFDSEHAPGVHPDLGVRQGAAEDVFNIPHSGGVMTAELTTSYQQETLWP